MRDTIDHALLTPQTLICDDHAWGFPGDGAAPGGYGRLRIWTTEEGPLLVVVTECGIGTSVMNAANAIQQALRARFDRLDVVVLEHWPATESIAGCETLDYVAVDEDGQVQWNRIEPLNVDELMRQTWMRRHGRRLLEAGGPWSLPPELVERLRE